MKKIYDCITVFMVAIAALSFTACDEEYAEDVDEAIDLSGIWEGAIYGNYYYDRYGERYEDWDTEIQFVQDDRYSRDGVGHEVDYSIRNSYVVESDFAWHVRDGKIYLDYDDGYRVVISEYQLYSVGSGMRFKGFFNDRETGGQLAEFNLVKVAEWSYPAKQHATGFQPAE